VAEKILLAEDDAALAKIFKNALAKAGYEVTLIASGADVVTPFATGGFDLFVTDLMMPGATGEDGVRSLEILGSDKKILVVTAVDDRERLDEVAKMPNVLKVLQKPISIAALLDEVKQALAR